MEAIVARHELKAPFAGVISVRHAELGEWVNPGDGLLELVATTCDDPSDMLRQVAEQLDRPSGLALAAAEAAGQAIASGLLDDAVPFSAGLATARPPHVGGAAGLTDEAWRSLCQDSLIQRCDVTSQYRL